MPAGGRRLTVLLLLLLLETYIPPHYLTLHTPYLVLLSAFLYLGACLLKLKSASHLGALYPALRYHHTASPKPLDSTTVLHHPGPTSANTTLKGQSD